jgi:hypothetical protein
MLYVSSYLLLDMILSLMARAVTNAAGSLNPDIAGDHRRYTRPFIPPKPYYSSPFPKTPQTTLLFPSPPKASVSSGTRPTSCRRNLLLVHGPKFETAAEDVFLRSTGGDLVGASAVPEVFAVREQDMEVLALSLVR